MKRAASGHPWRRSNAAACSKARSRAPVATEFQEQAAVIEWADLIHVVVRGHSHRLADFLYAIPNGELFNRGKFTDRQRLLRSVRLKKLGFRHGVLDLALDLPRGKYHGLRVEMKKVGEGPTPAQVRWMQTLNGVGFRAVCCAGAPAAIAEIRAYCALGEFTHWRGA